jgi:hypothetical protein
VTSRTISEPSRRRTKSSATSLSAPIVPATCDRAWRASWAPAHTQDDTTSGLVADLRAAAAQRGYDVTTARFIGELRAASAEFAGLWDAHHVSALQPRFKLLQHPRVGALPLECGVLQGRAPGQRLILFRAAPGTPAVGRLATLAQGGDSQAGDQPHPARLSG